MGDISPGVESLLRNFSAELGDKTVPADLKTTCNMIIPHSYKWKVEAPLGGMCYPWEESRPISDSILSTAALVALRLRRVDLLERVVEVAYQMLSLPRFEGFGMIITAEG